MWPVWPALDACSDGRLQQDTATIAECHTGLREGCELNRQEILFQSRVVNIWDRVLLVRKFSRLYLKKSSSLPGTGYTPGKRFASERIIYRVQRYLT